MIHHGDCLEVMAAMEPESVDAIVTDPPYGLSFMGKEWDRLTAVPAHTGPQWGGYGWHGSGPTDPMKSQLWHQQWAEAAYRVAKPSAYLLAFGGTRTVHRMTVALEDAGWIIRDMLVWAYASGFPKSKASLKPAWEPIVMARKPGPLRDLAIDACRIPTDELAGKVYNNRAGSPIYGNGSGIPTRTEHGAESGRWPANVILTDPIFDGGVEGVVGGGEAGPTPGSYRYSTPDTGNPRIYGQGAGVPKMEERVGYGDSGTYSRFFLLPRDSRSDALSGIIGTCHICGAPIAETPSTARTRRPDTAPLSADTLPSESLARPVSDAVSPSGSPATATAPRRAPTLPDGMPASMASGSISPDQTETPSGTNGTGTSSSPEQPPDTTSLSDQPARTAEQPPISTDTTTTIPAPWMCERCADDATHGRTLPPPRLIGHELQPDEGNYTRFLIIPKADRADREPVLGGLPEQPFSQSNGGKAAIARGEEYQGADASTGLNRVKQRANNHPTVKPTELMRHLVRLVTPPGGLVLDPFLGSGSTGLACELEGFPWVGIEREAEYVAIAEARLNGTQRGLGLDVDAPTAPRNTSKSHWPATRSPHKSEGWGFSRGQQDLLERTEDVG